MCIDDGNDEEHKDFTVTEKIPANLMSDYYGNGHCVFVDNFYTSPRLAEYMLDNDTYLCGTINCKRCNYSKAIVLEELEKGAAVFYKSGQLLACKYQAIKNKSNNQPKIVYTLSTAHTATMFACIKPKTEQGNLLEGHCSSTHWKAFSNEKEA